MKPAHDPNNENCSCTTCTYKSGSDRSPVRSLIQGGTRIDKLFLGKYIPLRERKLLDRLVRTRAVYDDIRNQLLSESESSMKEKPNLKPRKPKAPIDLKGRKSSAILEIVDMVDRGNITESVDSECCSCCVCGSKTIHDHGAHPEMRKHKRVRASVDAMRRSGAIMKRKAMDAKRGGRGLMQRVSKTSSMMRDLRVRKEGGGHMRDLSQTMSRTSMMLKKRMGDAKRNVRATAKTIMSEPEMKRRSQKMVSNIKRLKPRVQAGEQTMFEGILSKKLARASSVEVGAKKKHRKGRSLRESYQKMKKSKDRMIERVGEGTRKAKESKARLKRHVGAGVRKSLDRIQDSVQTMKRSLEELNLPIQDSIAKYRAMKANKHLHGYEECEECIRKECDPRECLKIIKLKRVHKADKVKKERPDMGKKDQDKKDQASMERGDRPGMGKKDRAGIDKKDRTGAGKEEGPNVEKKDQPSLEKKDQTKDQNIGMKPKVSTTGAQVVTTGVTEKTGSTKGGYVIKEIERIIEKDGVVETVKMQERVFTQKATAPEQAVNVDVATTEIKKEKKTTEPSKPKSEKETKLVKSTTGMAPSKSKLVGPQQKRKEDPTTSIVLKTSKRKRTVTQQVEKNKQQPAKTSSPISITLEMRNAKEPSKPIRINVEKKERPVGTKVDQGKREKLQTKMGSRTKMRSQKREVQTGQALKRCFCTLKLKGKGYKPKPKISTSMSQSQTNKFDENLKQGVQTNAIKARDMACTICDPKKCDPKTCMKFSKNRHRGNNTKKGSRSVSSMASSTRSSSKSTIASQERKKAGHKARRKYHVCMPGECDPQTCKDKIKKRKMRLLPYECEPGICVPGECDPYACLDLINQRNMKYSDKYSNTDFNRLHGRQSNTDRWAAKSTSSFTSKSKPHKVKKVQSTMGTRDKKQKPNALRPVQTTHSTPNRQVVRISSSFSFNVEFYKDNDNSGPADVVDTSVKPSTQSTETFKRIHMKERGSQDKKNRKHHKSTAVLAKKKNRGSFIAPMKRCFCTLKLQTKDHKKIVSIESASIGTETPIENAIQHENVMHTKGTKTKRDKQKYGYVLEPYECEPGICVPGECDPYECLQRIQMRQLKDSSTATDRAKMKSATSVTQRRRFRSKGSIVQSKSKGQKVATKTHKAKAQPKYEPVKEKTQRQTVRIGSTFSFDIQFNKDKTQSVPVYETRTDTISVKPAKKKKNRGGNPREPSRSSRGDNPREQSSSHRDSQASVVQAHKAAGIRPMLKRCFCTLKLQEKQNNKINMKSKPPKVITVSTVTVTETKIKSHKNLFMDNLPKGKTISDSSVRNIQHGNWANALYNFSSSSRVISKSSIVFRYKEMQSYFRKNSVTSVKSHKFSNRIYKKPLRDTFGQSNFILPTLCSRIDERFAYSENCIIRCNNVKKRCLKNKNSQIKHAKICLRSQKSSNFSEPRERNHHVSQLKEQKYYTMNVQVPESRKKYKLKPYECEPGVCVPDECDPYECQKLIMKRLMKKTSKMSGTTMRSKSMSSSTGQSPSSSKRLQAKKPRAKAKKVPAPSTGMSFKTVPNKHKQAVRVGSSFSFNVEFSKDKSAPAPVEYAPRPVQRAPRPSSRASKVTNAPRKKIKEHGTKSRGMHHRDQDAQHGTETASKGSGMKPIMQRCFCTLKLQKKGKNQMIQHKEIVPQKPSHRGTETPPEAKREFIASRTMMNAGQNTGAHKLLPYECEPLVCVPGECDPYECLERIKRRNKNRKDSGTGAMQYKSSSGSMTGRSKYRSQGKQVRTKQKHKQIKSRGSTSTPSRSIRTEDKKSKQAVRIGSSFSFNVEFFKDNVHTSSPSVQRAPPPVPRESKPPRPPKTPKVKQKNAGVSDKRKLRESGSQDSKAFHHRDSQMESSVTEGKGTMTNSLMKRCFCTKNLHAKQKPEAAKRISVQSKSSQANHKKPFMERCFCVMKKLKGQKPPKEPPIYSNAGTETMNEPAFKDKKVVTRSMKSPRHELLPYECEPGICVPGECDPYECDKLIKARNIKLQTKGAYTDRQRTRSTSSNYSSQTSKARKTQSYAKATSSSTKTRPSKVVKEVVEPVQQVSSNRQLVRIGSSFSFSVEFYKDRSPNRDEVQAAAKAIRYKPEPEPKPKKKSVKAVKTDKPKINTQDRASMGSNATSNQETQANKPNMKDQGAGIGHVLKRCFCTLKLQKNKKKENINYATQSTETMPEIPTLQNRAVGTGKRGKLKPYECEPGVCVPYQCDPNECDIRIKKRLLKETGVMTTTKKEKPLGNKLLPYECEPGVCVPGECDPYECEKRIKKRNMRDSGTATRKYGGKSVSSEFRTTPTKARTVQYKNKERRRRSQSVSTKRQRKSRPSTVRTRKPSIESSTRNSVRIGSGFSFDVEFYKNKSKVNQRESKRIYSKPKAKPRKSYSSSANQSIGPSTKDTKMQHRKGVRDTDSQIYGKKVRNTGVNPFLKRCFCTLKLQKSGNMSSGNNVISRDARDKNVYFATLLPYECEPGVCIPGECDPYECQKRIQRRFMRSQYAGTERSSSTSSTTTPGAKFRTTQSQALRRAQKQKVPKSTYAKSKPEYETPKPVPSSSSSSRQAVHIGSSFKFDVEFYKGGSIKSESKRRETYVEPKKRTRDMKTTPKHKGARTSGTSQALKRQHNRMQTDSRTESKSTGIRPKLKRCFCTLALQKNSPPETSTKATFRNDDLSDLYAFSKNQGTGMRKKYKLLPYECEPGSCVPGSCDPYECYERIKRRMRDRCTATDCPGKKYASSITSKDAKYKSANTEPMRERKRRERPTMASFKERAPRVSKVTGANARQAVRIGSNFSFSVEFYKERPNVKIPKSVYRVKAIESRPSVSKLKKAVPQTKKVGLQHEQTKCKDMEACTGNFGVNRESQSQFLKNTSRGTTMGAFLKRCFCTLNLGKNNKPQNGRKSYNEKPPRIEKVKERPPETNKSAVVQTQDKYTKNNAKGLLPYECEPNFCIPGECDPYACLERIKRRNIRRQSRRTGTHIRGSQVSVGNMASRMVPRTSRYMQSCGRKACHATRPSQSPAVVEEPRFTHMFDNMKHGVKIGSNFNFDIEFYKDKTTKDISPPEPPVPVRYVEHKVKPVKVKQRDVVRKSAYSESRPMGMHKGIGDTCNKSTCDAQTHNAAMVDKGAGANNMLKRCFCTLKLQKNQGKVLGVHRLAIEHINPMENRKRFSQKRLLDFKDNVMNNLTIDPKIKQIDCHINEKNNQVKECKEMTTIYPYIPYKYNKNASHTLLNNIDTKDSTKNQFLKKLTRKPIHGKRNSRKAEKVEVDRVVPATSQCNKTSRMQNLKRVIRRILPGFFFKKQDVSSFTEIAAEKNHKHSKKTPRPSQRMVRIAKQEILKTSKSDRQSSDTKALTIPKKTISLKVTKVPEKKKNKEYVFYNQSRLKKHSRYQSGDTGQNQCSVNHCLNPNPFIFGCYNTHCAYCQVLTSKKIDKSRGFKKIKSASTTSNTNQKKGLVTHNIKEKKILLSKTESMKRNDDNIEDGQMKKVKKIYGNKTGEQVTTEYTTDVKDKHNFHETKGMKSTDGNVHSRGNLSSSMSSYLRCLCSVKDEKTRLSYGDVPPFQKEVNITNTRNKLLTEYVYFMQKPKNIMDNKLLKCCPCPTGDKKKSRSGDVPLNKTIGSDDDPTKMTKKARKKSKLQDGDGPPTQYEKEEKPKNKKKDRKESGKNNDATCTTCGPCKSLLKKRKSISPGDASAAGDGVKGKGVKRKTVGFVSDGETIEGKDGKNEKGKAEKVRKTSVFSAGKKEKGKAEKGKVEGGKAEGGKVENVQVEGGKAGKGKKEKGKSENEEEEKGKAGKRRKTSVVSGGKKGKGKGDKDTTTSGKKLGAGDDPKGKKSENLKSKIQCTCEKIKIYTEKRKKPKDGKFVGAKITVKGKGDPNQKPKVPQKISKADKYKTCVCGSSICSKVKDDIARSKALGYDAGKSPPCICGSKPCAKEMKALAKARKNLICRCPEEIKKLQTMEKKEKKRIEEMEQLQHKFDEADKERALRRQAYHKRKEKELKRSKKDGDVSLAVTSLTEIVRLGLTASSDVLRNTHRAIFHPKLAAHRMNTLAHNPSQAASRMSTALKNVGAIPTMSRARRRCTYMKNYQWVKSKLIQNAAFRFAVNVWEKNPKKRLKKPKKVRKREPLDFECSLFMASLRRRPCLIVYYACPMFYPHCLSMLNLWKQFTDMILVLLAVVAWSPCIVLMEVCRAFVCCFFCTG